MVICLGTIRKFKIIEQFADHPVLIACHHHPFAMQSKWIDQHKLKTQMHF
jgi:3',5'-cyclic AMP phosphodiesterase CpdA